MESELVPRFVRSPAYQALLAQGKPTGVTEGILRTTSRAGLNEGAATGDPVASRSNALKRQRSRETPSQSASTDFSAAATAHHATVEDVLAGMLSQTACFSRCDGTRAPLHWCYRS